MLFRSKPSWTVNHGNSTSFYYEDPDGNTVETMMDNYTSKDTQDYKRHYQWSEYFGEMAEGNFDPDKMLTLYDMMVDFGWVDTYWAVVAVGLMEPFGIFLFRQSIQGIPDELMDAARIDGSGTLQTYFNVVLPLIKPALAAYSIFLFMWSWSDFLWPLIVINTETLKPLEVGILGFSDINNPEYVKMMAASTVAVAQIGRAHV
mgnify:CR=1 FL=1